MEKIILFGGSFDPIHKAHLQIAHLAIKKIPKSRLIFIPNLKSFDNKSLIASPTQRMKLIQLAINNEFEVSDYELNLKSISYTIDTLNHFQLIYPNAQLYWLLGDDQFKNFSNFHKSNEILLKYKLIVANRNNINLKSKNIIALDNNFIPISGKKIKTTNLITDLPEKVLNEINETGLYAINRLKNEISEKRMLHSMRVAKMAKEISKIHCPELIDIAFSAGCYHDICKEWSETKLIFEAKTKLNFDIPPWRTLHGFVAIDYLKTKYKFKNQLLLNAIGNHTLPMVFIKKPLTILDKIIYCCDKLEPLRTNKDLKNISYYRDLLKINVDQTFNEIIKYYKKVTW